MTTLNYFSNYSRYYCKILPGKYDPEVVPVMNLVHVQCYSLDPSVFVRWQQCSKWTANRSLWPNIRGWI